MQILDDLDHRLVAVLREDGRAPISKLASILGVSRATVQSRLDRLLDSGTVLGFTIRAREDYDEDTVRAVMMIEVTGRSTTAVIKRLRGMPELHALHAGASRSTYDERELGSRCRTPNEKSARFRPRPA